MKDYSCSAKEIESLLAKFIKFRSTENHPDQKEMCLDWVQNTFLRKNATTVQRGTFQESPWLYVPNDQSTLLIFAHCDVVPGLDHQFSLTKNDDKLFGRGTSDMKGNILPFLMAYRDAVNENESLYVSILLTTDEEIGGKTIPHVLDEGIVSASVAFTPDSSDKGIVCEHKGVVWAKLIAQGKGGHGAYPWNTENPMWLLSDALLQIKSAFPCGEENDWKMTVSPTMLAGSAAQNQVDDAVSCTLDIRFPKEVCTTAQEALQKVEAVLPLGCTLTEILSASFLDTPKNHTTIQLFASVAESTLKTEIPFRREHGGTDARYFSERGIPAFLYGPTGGGLHSTKEWVSLSSLKKHYTMYRNLLNTLSR